MVLIISDIRSFDGDEEVVVDVEGLSLLVLIDVVVEVAVVVLVGLYVVVVVLVDVVVNVEDRLSKRIDNNFTII